jgi:hypothetical protein
MDSLFQLKVHNVIITANNRFTVSTKVHDGVIDRTVIYYQIAVNWIVHVTSYEFRQQLNWETSHRTTGYFKMKARNSKPSVFSVGIVNATDTSVCTRLCMRIDGCKSFAMDEQLELVEGCRWHILHFLSVSGKILKTIICVFIWYLCCHCPSESVHVLVGLYEY